MNSQAPLVLCGDIGGTNSRFALHPARRGSPALARAILPTAGYSSFAALLAELPGLLDFDPAQAAAAAVAVAGPVRQARFCDPPNIGFSLNLDSLPKGLLPARAELLNDFTAQALGCREAAPAELAPVLPGAFDPARVQAVIGAGTGLGKAALLPEGQGGCVVVSSEGGHATFPFVGPQEAEFQAFVLERTGEPYARWETVVSGQGLALTHAFLTGRALAPAEVSAEVGPDDETAAWFARFYGRACRDWALSTLAEGGLFVCAGVAAKNPWAVRHAAFAREFRISHTHEKLLSGIGVRLVTDELTGLKGALGRALALAGA